VYARFEGALLLASFERLAVVTKTGTLFFYQLA
jgi:hypothetical protein